jgi:hypothetical protein
LKIPYIIDTIKALGFSSPFDTKLIITDLWELFKKSLLPTPMFMDYARKSQLFSKSTKGMTGEWDLNKVVKALNMVLGSAGLALKGTRSRSKKKSVDLPEMMYCLDEMRVSKMMELVKLCVLRRGFRASESRVQAKLLEHPLTCYGRLMDLSRVTFGSYAFRDADE